MSIFEKLLEKVAEKGLEELIRDPKGTLDNVIGFPADVINDVEDVYEGIKKWWKGETPTPPENKE